MTDSKRKIEDQEPWFLWDEPVDWQEQAGSAGIMDLGWVDQYTTALPDNLDKGPLAIAVFGPWGSGKTSILRKIREKAGKNTVWFEPWRYENENNLMIPLLAQMTADLAQSAGEDKKLRKQILKAGKKLIGQATKFAVRQGINWAVSASGAGAAIDAIGGDSSDLGGKVVGAFTESSSDGLIPGNETLKSEVEAFRENFQGLVKSALAKNASPVYVMIDDLDRCSHLQVIRLLEAIKNFLWEPNVIFVMALDREQVTNAVAQSLKEHVDEENQPWLHARVRATRYLEKFFLHTIDIGHAFPGYEQGVLEIRDAMPGEIRQALTPEEQTKVSWNAIDNIFKFCEPNLRRIKRLARWIYFEAKHQAHTEKSFAPALAEFGISEFHTGLWLKQLSGRSSELRKRNYGVIVAAVAAFMPDDRFDQNLAAKAVALLSETDDEDESLDPWLRKTISPLGQSYAGNYISEQILLNDYESLNSLYFLLNEAVKLRISRPGEKS